MPSPAQLQQTLDAVVNARRAPGVVCAFWRDGNFVAAASGLANVGTGVKMTPDTGFLTGSVTKVWTTTLVMTLVEQGMLDLEKPIAHYIPGVQFGADPAVAKILTIRNLLNHSSGVNTGDLFVDARPYPEGVADYLAAIARAGKLTEPNVVSSYNNIGWMVLDLVLRQVTGKNFHQLLTERIVAPLDLRRTVTSADQAVLGRMAIGSLPTSDGRFEATPQFAYPSAWAAAGTTLITTVADAVTFLRVHLVRGGSSGTRRLISESSVELMQRPTISHPTGTGGFGLGWMYVEEGRRVVFHLGGSPGGSAISLISPEENLAMAAYVNTPDVSAMATVLDLLLPGQPSPLRTSPADILANTGLAKFVGTYIRSGMRVEIELRAGALVGRLTAIADELVGVDLVTLIPSREVRLAPTGESSLVIMDRLGELSPRSILSFSELTDDGYQLLYAAPYLARRQGPARRDSAVDVPTG